MKGNLSDLLLRSLIGKQNAQKEIRDRLLPGFGCRCSKGGTISFFAMGRQRGVVRGSPIRITVGTYPVWSAMNSQRASTPSGQCRPAAHRLGSL